jgi:arabinan endo-1,5-alpha-L-arabinosidase
LHDGCECGSLHKRKFTNPDFVANQRWLRPGGASILQRPEGGLIVFHAYDAATGKPALQIPTLIWKDGWA